MFRRLFLFLSVLVLLLFPALGMRTACLNSSLADLWHLAGGSVDITVGEAVSRGFASEDAVLVDSSSGRNINTEILIAANPDFIIGSSDTPSHVRLKSFMDEMGREMILVDMDSFADFLSVYRTLTDITGREDLYERFGTGQKEAIGRIIAEAEEEAVKPRVLFIRAGSAFSAVRAKRAEDHFAAGIIEDLGGVNIADESDILTDKLSLEAMLTADIDKILVVPQGDEAASVSYVESLFSSPGWKNIKAIENGEVYFLPKELFHYKPNEHWAEAYEMMKEALYG